MNHLHTGDLHNYSWQTGDSRNIMRGVRMYKIARLFGPRSHWTREKINEIDNLLLKWKKK